MMLDQVRAMLRRAITAVRHVADADTVWDTPAALSRAGTELASLDPREGSSPEVLDC